MSEQMKKLINEIIGQHGLTEVFQKKTEVHLKLESSTFMPLVIERVGDTVSVAHYGELNGDAMRDPEVVFRLKDWKPANIQQDYLGSYREVFVEMGGVEHYYPRLLRELESFAKTWAKNLREQGFADPTRVKASSLSHQHLVERAAEQRAFKALSEDVAPDAHLEAQYEARAEMDTFEPYELSVYDGTYSQE